VEDTTLLEGTRDIECLDSNNCLNIISFNDDSASKKDPSHNFVGRLGCLMYGNFTGDYNTGWERVFIEAEEWYQSSENIGSFLEMYEIEFVDKDNLFIACDKAIIRRNKNRIESGVQLEFEDIVIDTNSKASRILSLSMLNANKGICLYGISTDFYVATTNDGWDNFEIMYIEDYIKENHESLDTWYNLINIAKYYNEDFVYGICQFTHDWGIGWMGFTKSTDNGKTWSFDSLADFSNTSLSDIYFIDENTGWICGDSDAKNDKYSYYDLVLKTTDGGNSWTEMLNDSIFRPKGLSEIKFYDKHNGIAVGREDKILTTSDGGETWFNHFDKWHEPHYEYNGRQANNPVLHVDYAGTTPLIGTMNYGVVWYLEDSPSSVQSVSDAGIKTYPNPFYESVTISFPEFMQGNAKIEIYNSVGVLIDQSSFVIGGGEMVFTPEADAKGVYFYRIHIGKEIYEGSFVKM
jgi:hypothetical protein